MHAGAVLIPLATAEPDTGVRQNPRVRDLVIARGSRTDQVQENRPAILIESQNHCILMSNPRLGGSEDARCGGGDGRDAGVKGRG